MQKFCSYTFLKSFNFFEFLFVYYGQLSELTGLVELTTIDAFYFRPLNKDVISYYIDPML